MKRICRVIVLFLILEGALGAKTSVSLGEYSLKDDSQALNYCYSDPHSYVVIVWPKGFDSLEYIINKITEYASIKYVKIMPLNRKKAFLLYRKLHTSMSYKTAKKYFKPYISSDLHYTFHCAALVIHTDQSLDTLVKWKKEIRNYIGENFYSIHINDYYNPQTIEAAQAIFS